MNHIEQKSEIAGYVWKIEVKPGDTVAEGDTLLILESMKMEIPVMATDAGTVYQILVAVKEEVREGQAVVIVETESA